jgi:BirA family biotin operon repressor/biotin-[acetyl-CoA-carboxylase] ligase
VTWFGHSGDVLARALAVPLVVAVRRVDSTMDVAHGLAADGAAAGSIVLAEEQFAGRGRNGRAWTSPAGSGIWMTLIERPRRDDGIDVLSLRLGLHLAPVLERWSPGPVRLKWPNDLYIARRKLAGVLVEARWRGDRLDWVAIGLGVNLRPPAEVPEAIGLEGGEPEQVLSEIVPAARAAAFATGPLREAELAEFAARDLAIGQQVLAPGAGLVRGISESGELLLEASGVVTRYRAGSLVFAPT